VIERREHGIKHGRWKAGLDQVSYLQAWVRVLRLKYISKSNKSSQASAVGSFPKPSFSILGLARVPRHESRRRQRNQPRLHPPRAEPGRFIGAFSTPNELTFPSPAQLAAVALQCVTKGKCALFQATLLEDGNRWFHRHPHIGTFYLDGQGKRDERDCP
jgi:hypothetical protein